MGSGTSLCDRFTKDDFEAVFGQSVLTSPRSADSDCTYTNEDTGNLIFDLNDQCDHTFIKDFDQIYPDAAQSPAGARFGAPTAPYQMLGVLDTNGCILQLNVYGNNDIHDAVWAKVLVKTLDLPSTEEICNTAYPGGTSKTIKVSGGTNTRYDRAASLLQICEGFGAPSPFQLTPGMSCSLIAAAAVYVTPPGGAAFTDDACVAKSIDDTITSGQWISGATGVSEDVVCGFLGDAFSTGVGVFAAGATSETGPGAVAVGVATFKALSAASKVACGGLFDGGANSVGTQLESNNETNVMMDVLHNGKCILLSQKGGISGTSWHSYTC